MISRRGEPKKKSDNAKKIYGADLEPSQEWLDKIANRPFPETAWGRMLLGEINETD